MIVEPSPANRKAWSCCGQLSGPMARAVVMYSPRGAAASGSQWPGRDGATWGTAAAETPGTTGTDHQDAEILSGRTVSVVPQRDSASRNHGAGLERTACGLDAPDPDTKTRSHADRGDRATLGPSAATRECLLLQHLLLQHLRLILRA